MKTPSTELVSLRDPVDTSPPRRRPRRRPLRRLRLLVAALAAVGVRGARRMGVRARRSVSRSTRALPGLLVAVVLVVVIKSAPWVRACVGSPTWGQRLHALTDRVLEPRFRGRAVLRAVLGLALWLTLGWLSEPSGATAPGPGGGLPTAADDARSLVLTPVALLVLLVLVMVLVGWCWLYRDTEGGRRFWRRAAGEALLGAGLYALGAISVSSSDASAADGGGLAIVGAGWLLELVLWAPLVLVAVLSGGRRLLGHTEFGRVRARFGVNAWAGYWDLHRHVSAHAVREVAVSRRPSVAAALPTAPARTQVGAVAAGTGRVRRVVAIEVIPVTECGIWCGRTAVGPWWGMDCYISTRDTAGLIAPPQTGKTGTMIHHILDHPGAVVSTSTKPDIYLLTAKLRAERARSGTVELFNPDNLGQLGSSLRWDPVRGCAEFRAATARAALLVGARKKKSADDSRWDDWATEVLTGLLMVADLAELSMRDIARWVYAPTDEERGAVSAQKLMGRFAAIPAEVADSLAQILTTQATKTRDSVFIALRGAIGFMSDPAIAELCTPARDQPVFDVETFLAELGTLYMLGSDESEAATAPLLSAFTGYLFAAAKNLATRQPSERLDPSLLFELDEAALITPVPLPQWLADAAGRGIQIIWSVQTPSQLRATWGEDGADSIINATNALLVFGGLKAEGDLRQASVWCEERHELVPDPDGDGPGHAKYERVPGCPPARIRLLDPWHAMFVYRMMPATVVRVWPGWDRDDVRAATGIRLLALMPGTPAPRRAAAAPRVAAERAAPEPTATATSAGSAGRRRSPSASPAPSPGASPDASPGVAAAPDPGHPPRSRARARRGRARDQAGGADQQALDLDLDTATDRSTGGNLR